VFFLLTSLLPHPLTDVYIRHFEEPNQGFQHGIRRPDLL
jgi:hypothetical protein